MDARTCTKCGTTYPETNEFFNRNKRNLRGLERQCKQCKNAYRRELHEWDRKHKGDAMREQDTARKREARKDPKTRERLSEASKRYQNKLKADPVTREQYLAARRDSQARRMERIKADPVLWAEFQAKRNAAHKREVQKRRNDPELAEARRAKDREYARSRRLELGLPVKNVNSTESDRIDSVEPAPLREPLRAFERLHKTEFMPSTRAHLQGDRTYSSWQETLSLRAGVSVKMLYRILHTDERISLDAADRICIALALDLNDLYPA